MLRFLVFEALKYTNPELTDEIITKDKKVNSFIEEIITKKYTNLLLTHLETRKIFKIKA